MKYPRKVKDIFKLRNLRTSTNIKYTQDNQGVFVDKNDIIIAWDGAYSGLVSYGLDGVIGSTLSRLRLVSNNIFTPYLGRFLQSRMELIQSNRNGTTIPHVNKSTLLSMEIPLPPIEEQKRIAAILDKADEIRRKRRETIKLTEELLRSTFLEMFGDPVINPKGWEVEKLGNLTSKIGSGATPKGGQSNYKSEGIPLIRSMNIYDYAFNYNGLAYIDDIQAQALNNVIVQESDILLNITGASVARCTIVPEHLIFSRVNQHVAIIRSIPEILNPFYLLSVINSNSYKKKLLRISISKGSTREALTKIELENLLIPLPDIELQHKFAAINNQLLSTLKKYQLMLETSDNLFNALLQRAFRGEL